MNEKKNSRFAHPDYGLILLTFFFFVSVFAVPLFSVYFLPCLLHFFLNAGLFSSPNLKWNCAKFVISNCVSICSWWILLSINCYSNQSAELNAANFGWRLQRTANHDVVLFVFFFLNSIQCIINYSNTFKKCVEQKEKKKFCFASQ